MEAIKDKGRSDLSERNGKAGAGRRVVSPGIGSVEVALISKSPLNGNGRAAIDVPARSIAVGDLHQATSSREAEFDLRARGIRGLYRFVQIARVLGTLALYLFLDGYDIRFEFNRRMHSHRLVESKPGRFGAWMATLRFVVFDRSVRVMRFIVFRGAEGSDKKTVRLDRQAVWLKDRLIRLGPTFIKIGQALGTRADLLPLPYVKQLQTLQDQVPAFSNEEAFTRIKAELGRSVAESYAEIDDEPVAAASLGQVYRARLHSGEEVAVKVQRPNLEARIGFDIAVLRRLTRYLDHIPHANDNADWEGMLREFSTTIHEEMDYEQEASNADRFRANFSDWRVIHVPKIHWTHTTKRVLTMEFIRGTKVIDIEGLRAKRISAVKVNRLLIRTYLKQLLEDGFFHADPHPGNLLVMDSGRLAFFDFGMTGRIAPNLQSQMIDAFFHVVGRDVEGLAQDLINLNFLKPGVNPDTVRPVVEGLFRHYLNLKLGEVNFRELTYDLAEVMYEYPFRLPANFTFVMRALMTLEGIGIVTDPEFSFFETAKPFAKEFMLRREGKQFRRLLIDKISGRGRDGRIEWRKMWKLAKMAAKMYLEPK